MEHPFCLLRVCSYNHAQPSKLPFGGQVYWNTCLSGLNRGRKRKTGKQPERQEKEKAIA